MLWAQSATKGYIRANNKHFFLKLTRELVFFNKIATGSTPGYMSRGWIYVFAVTSCNVRRHLVKIWNRMRPRVAGQNQQTGELICTEKTSHEHNNRDLKSSWQLACEHNTRYVNSNGGTCSNQTHPEAMRLWWKLCALCLLASKVRVTVGNSGLCCCGLVRSFGC